MKNFLIIFSLLLLPINIAFANSATEHGTDDIYEDLLHNRYYLAWYMDIDDILSKYDLQLKSSEGSVSVYTLSLAQDEPSLTFYFDEDKLYTVSLYFNKQVNLQKQQYDNFSKYYVIKNGLNKILPLSTVIISQDGNTLTWQNQKPPQTVSSATLPKSNPPYHYIYNDILNNAFPLTWGDDLTKINEIYNLKYSGYGGKYYKSYVLPVTEKYSPDEPFIILYIYNDKLYKIGLFFDKKTNSIKQQYDNFTKYYLIQRGFTKNFGEATAVTNDGKLTVWQGTAVDESSVQDIVDGVPAFYEKYFNYLYETHQI